MTEFATYPSLRDQVAFVSGGATGLGAEFVAQLAAQGVKVGFVDIQDDAGQALAEQVGGLYQHCDVRDIEALQQAIARKLGFRLVDHRLELYGVPLDD